MTKKSCLVTILIIFGLIALMLSSAFYGLGKLLSGPSTKTDDPDSKYTYISGKKDSPNKILQIDISGVILDTNSQQSPILDILVSQQATFGYDIKKELVEAAKDQDIKAVLLTINSPGGTITGAKAISDGVEKYESVSGRNVYSHVSGLAASGAYWVASSTKEISADYGSLTGSIGVLLGPFKEYDKVLAESTQFGDSIATESGINTYYITAGSEKDFDNPYKKMSEKARSTLQEGVNNEYNVFVSHVSSSRNIPEDKIKTEIGALIYENSQAQKLGLIDSTESYDDYILKVAEKAGLAADEYEVVSTKRDLGFWEEIFQTTALATGLKYLANNSNLDSLTQIKSQLQNRMLFLLPTFSL